MSSLAEIRTNLHNKVREINPEELFRTPYKPFVQVYVDNKETAQSFREYFTISTQTSSGCAHYEDHS